MVLTIQENNLNEICIQSLCVSGVVNNPKGDLPLMPDITQKKEKVNILTHNAGTNWLH